MFRYLWERRLNLHRLSHGAYVGPTVLALHTEEIQHHCMLWSDWTISKSNEATEQARTSEGLPLCLIPTSVSVDYFGRFWSTWEIYCSWFFCTLTRNNTLKRPALASRIDLIDQNSVCGPCGRMLPTLTSRSWQSLARHPLSFRTWNSGSLLYTQFVFWHAEAGWFI